MHVDQAELLTIEDVADNGSRETEEHTIENVADNGSRETDEPTIEDGEEDDEEEELPPIQIFDDGRWRCMVCTSIKRGGDTGVKRGVCKSCDDQLKNLKSRLDSLFCILGDKSCHPTRCTGCLIARYVWWAHYPNSPNYKDPVIIRRFELWLKGYEYPIPFKSKKRANHIASLQ